VKLLRDLGVKKVKIYDTNHNVLKAFEGSGISLSVAVPNDQVVKIADNQKEANHWVEQNIVKYGGLIKSIAVGNEYLSANNTALPPSKLVPAMKNVYNALKANHLGDNIRVSTPHAMSIIDTPGFPPSKGKFKDETVMKDVLQFLHATKSVFMLNIYPFLAYANDPHNLNLNYALLQDNASTVTDGGLKYDNMFDAMVDTVISAMTKVGYKDMRIVITETGWPSGGSSRPGVNPKNAQVYNQNVIRHVLAKKGTPLRRNQSFPTYIFALYNENKKEAVGGGGEQNEEKHWGLYHPKPLKPVYETPLRFKG
jgi:exo-beta-1,3-glucanase (GH17 family)